MPRNVEIKAQIHDTDAIARRASSIADEGPVEISQDDTFFSCASGRLKLRKFSDHDGELIFYRREDAEGPKESFYLRSGTTDPNILLELLANAYGAYGRVRKCRQLFLVGRTRVHIDRVHELGDYLELEVVLEEDEPIERGVKEAHALMRKLGVEHSQLVRGAYVDLIREGDA